MNDPAERDDVSERDVLRATLSFNTRVFSAILGVFAGAALFALSLVSHYGAGTGHLAVALIGVFLPGYSASGWGGALIGGFWGIVLGALLGAGIYRINARHVLDRVDELMIPEGGAADFPRAVLRLDGGSLGLAIGLVGALGLITTTNLLVVRGTAAQSVHARLLSEVLPGYSVSPLGSIVGAAELFVVLYGCCRSFVLIYNAVARRRHPR
ncbi:MAG TPA: hypothetical protein VFF44_06590 [Casimicrobiaceae bacterium]|nr:hypothetical protein [Casimicrobiaceae bacterium]